MSEEQSSFFFNGINGATGQYLQESLTPEQIVNIAIGENQSTLQEIEGKAQDKAQDKVNKYFRPMTGVDAKNLAEAGWGVIFACDDSQAKNIREKLTSLLEHRKEQAKDYYREYKYRPGDSKEHFLVRQGVGNSSVVDPQKMPYYLLIVGDPETIPYNVQYQLDVAYAVGRIYFKDLEDYERYACNVVEAEKGKISRPRRAVFFGVHNQRDEATELSAKQLISPLSDWMREDKKIKGWEVQTLLKDEAKKEQLKKLLGGSETPAFLFTASHGVGFDEGHKLQLSHQGALLCQNWPGIGTPPTENPDFYFCADDVDNDARLHGLIAFHFACYSVGTPEEDSLAAPSEKNEKKRIAPKPFVARLPQRLLSRGALAVIGHVDRVLPSSFSESYGRKQLELFQDTLRRLMNGHPVGSAVESFNEHYSALACGLWTKIDDPLADKLDLSESWLSFRNARSYAIIGDPAVQLAVGDAPKFEQPVEKIVHLSLTPSTPEQSMDEETTVISEPASTVFEEGNLKQADHQLTQALEQFVNAVEQAPAQQFKQLQSIVEAAKNRLYEAAKTLESLKLKQAQFQLTQALEQFISTVGQTPAEQAEHLQPTVNAATELLDSLKQLS
jgi:hypothetical protein